MLFAGGRTPPIHPEKPASLAYSAATCAAPALSLGLISQASSQLSTLSDLTNLPTPSTSSAEQAKPDNLFIAEVLGEIGIDLVFVDGVLALLEQIRIMQRCLLTLAEALAARIIEQVIDHVLSQPFRLCDRRAYGRAIAALMRNRNLDAAHLLELVW